MASAFENFVNVELPKRIWHSIPLTGNLEPDKMLVTTGIGLETKLVSVPTGAETTSTITQQFTVTSEQVNNNTFQLTQTPVGSVEVWFNGLNLLNISNGDFIIIGTYLTLNPDHILTEDDLVVIKYTY